MPHPAPPIPITKQQALDLYFLEHRAKLIDLAAFLDRIDRAEGTADFRLDAFREATKILLDTEHGRARRVQESFSDHSETPIPVAPGKGATGAQPPSGSGGPSSDAEASDSNTNGGTP